MFPFYTSLKTPENLYFSDVFRGYKMRKLLRNELIRFHNKITTKTRNSPPEVFVGKGVLKICTRFTGVHPYRSVSCKANVLKSHFGMGVLP